MMMKTTSLKDMIKKDYDAEEYETDISTAACIIKDEEIDIPVNITVRELFEYEGIGINIFAIIDLERSEILNPDAVTQLGGRYSIIPIRKDGC